ncbi:hypothetical protein NDU88_006850 [Pleurodeles waltl]|uniref:Uncharacterized protein n=1 Tax=Pleurodeles waltl TaxID=8319 RepID=A0AAV7VSQ2_PLEWA|nr:hypothetical protein NDU88_006850 [Pleurodeles waltl]
MCWYAFSFCLHQRPDEEIGKVALNEWCPLQVGGPHRISPKRAEERKHQGGGCGGATSVPSATQQQQSQMQ